MAANSRLHEFDLRLCNYVRGNIAHTDDPRFVNAIREELDSSLFEYLGFDSDDGSDSWAKLLLNAAELWELETVIDNLSDRFSLVWTPYEPLHRDYVKTVPEIQKNLAKQTAEEWAESCHRYASDLEEPRLSVSEGMCLVGEWLVELRRYLVAMGRNDVLPAPKGAFPTPTFSDGTVPDSEEASDKQRDSDVAKVRKALQKLGADALPKKVLSEIGMNKQRFYHALQILQELGEYKGEYRPRKRKQS